MVSVDTHWRYNGLQVVRIENEHLQIDILPEAGGKIYNFIHKPSDRNLLWHSPRILPSRVPYGAGFDNNWSGGWDELFPNDVPTPAESGEIFPDHGEIWCQPCEWEVVEASPERASVCLTSYPRVLTARFEKTISLSRDESICRTHYRISNTGRLPILFIWDIHPAMVISPVTRLDLPATNGLVDPWREDRFAGGSHYAWPFAETRQGEKVDMRSVEPPESGMADLHYLPDIEAGWFAVTDTQKQVGFGMSFPVEVLPHLWLFRTFGGWRGLYTLIVEVCSGYPNDLSVARDAGTCTVLDAGESVEADVVAVAYTGIASVEHISQDGVVRGRDK